MDDTAIRTALVAWLTESSGVQVRRMNMEAPPPAEGVHGKPVPYGEYLLGDTQPIPLRPARATRFVADAPAGQELEATVLQPQRLTVSLQFLTPSATQASPDGTPWAKPLLERVLLALELEVHRRRLWAAGLGLIRVGAARDISAVAGTKWQGRATADVEFRVVASATETHGYFTQVGIQATFKTNEP